MNCSCFGQNLWAFSWKSFECKQKQQVLARGQGVGKCAAYDFLIPFAFRRMQMTWSPAQTARSSGPTRSRNSRCFSSSKVNLIFCFCFLPDEAREWREVTAAPSLFYTQKRSSLIHLYYPLLNLPTSPRLPPLPIRFSSRCAANDADPHLPAGHPGAGQPGSAAGRPRHLHGQVHRETV